MTVVFPVFVLAKDSREILCFSSLAEMQNYLERIDIENDEYEAWDANAWPIRMRVEEPLWLRLELKDEGPDPAGLLSDLRHFSKLAGVTLDEDELAPAAVYDRIMAN